MSIQAQRTSINPNRVDNLNRLLARPDHMAQKRMIKQLVPVHLDLPLFWKSHCAICISACVTFVPCDGIMQKAF